VTFCLLKNDFAERCRAKAQSAWFGAAVHRGVMEYMCPDVLDDTMWIRWIEIDGGLALQTNQPDMERVGCIGIELLHDKASSP